MRNPIRQVGAALAGALVVGLVLGLPESPLSMAAHAVSVPAIVLGIAALMLPPLYIASTTLGRAAPASQFAESSSLALGDAGLVLLGFAPPLAFLVATSSLSATVWLLGNAVLGLAALIAVRSLYYSLFFRSEGRRAMPLYLLWLVVTFAIAEHLFMATLNV